MRCDSLLSFAGTSVTLSCPRKVLQDKSGVELVVPSNFHLMSTNQWRQVSSKFQMRKKQRRTTIDALRQSIPVEN